MTGKQAKLIAALGIPLFAMGISPPSFAADPIPSVIAPLGLYIGGAFGRANVRVDSNSTSKLFHFDEPHAGWKAMLGIRPIAPLGAEFEYIDFGHPQSTIADVRTDARSRAFGLFAMGYLPIPLVDVFGKAGVARVQTIAHGSSSTVQPGGTTCSNSSLSCIFDTDHTQSRFAYGGGVQVKIARLGIRAEYERISASGADPSLLSLGATWTF